MELSLLVVKGGAQVGPAGLTIPDEGSVDPQLVLSSSGVIDNPLLSSPRVLGRASAHLCYDADKRTHVVQRQVIDQ